MLAEDLEYRVLKSVFLGISNSKTSLLIVKEFLRILPGANFVCC